MLGTTLILLGVGAAAVLTVLTARELVTQDEPEEPRPTARPGTASVELVFGTKGRGDQMAWASLLVFDRSDNSGAVAYVPARTAVEVPGRGLLALRDAFEGGGLPLLLVTAENLFGVTVDGYLQLSERDARVLMEEIGPLEVDVPGDVRVPAGGDTVRVVLSEGPQLLGPEAMTTLLYTAGLEPDDVELGGRHLAFWDGLFDAYSDEPGALIDAVSAAGGALGKSDLSPEAIAERVADLATISASARRLRSLPVTALEVAGARLYVPDDEEMGDFEAAVLGTAALSEQIKVQILNGNGAPGIGQEVAQRLVGQGFRVILSGNASRLDHETTLVIAYEDSAEARALARRARDLLGVGEVRVSTQEQGIVELTIVVGKDFLRSQ